MECQLVGPTSINTTFHNLFGTYVVYNVPPSTQDVRLVARLASGIMDKALLIPVPCNVKMHNNDPRGRIIEIHKGFHLPEGSGNVGEAVLTASCFAGVNEDEKELGSASLLVKCW
jgi:hypothetical protein